MKECENKNAEIGEKYSESETCLSDPKNPLGEDLKKAPGEFSSDIDSKFISDLDAYQEGTQREKIHKMSKSKEIVHIDENTTCGIGSFKPKWLQKYATARAFLVLYCIIGVLQGAYYSYFSGCMSTLEKRFAFKSQISGYIMVIKEGAPLIFGIPIGYFGGKFHMPRIMAMSMLMVVISCFLTVLPFMMYGPSQHLDMAASHNMSSGPEMCDIGSKIEICEEDDRPPTIPAVTMLALAGLIEGFGGVTFFAVGLAYMDNNAKKKNTPIYFAIAHALRLFGPILGYLMSSGFLKLNENPFANPNYGPEDPRWIGGWWMGFMLEGTLLMFLTVPLAMFPRHMPRAALPKNGPTRQDETFVQMVYGLFPALKRLSKNPIFVLLVLTTVMGAMGNFGHYVMLPKYMENQFHLTASDASLYSGPPGLFAIQLSVLIGGFAIGKYQPSAKFLAACLALSEVISAVGYIVLIIPKCQTVNLSNTGVIADGLNLLNECNAECLCTTAKFTPICGPDGNTTYFSPCHAGCKTEQHTYNQSQVFGNCSCASEVTVNSMVAPVFEKGFCIDEKCWSQALAYIVILPIFHFVTNIFRVADTIILVRCIDPGDKSAALGAFETLISLFGFIPYPIIFGALIDSACLVWEKSCGRTGNCWFYDMDKFNHMFHGVSALFSMFAAFCLLGICFLSSRLPDLYKEEAGGGVRSKMENDCFGSDENNSDRATTRC